MNACSVCRIRKAGRHFAKDGSGKITDICKKCATNGGDVKPKKAKTVHMAPAEVAPKIGASFDLPAGYGVRARTEDGRLVIEQDGQTVEGEARTDTVVLARHEAAKLLDWISRFAEPEAEPA